MPTMATVSDTLDTVATAPTGLAMDMASTTARGRLRLKLSLRPSPTTTAVTMDLDISDMGATSTARGRLSPSSTPTTLPSTACTATVCPLPSLLLLEDTLLLVATSPTLLALSTLPRGRLRLTPSPTTTAATMDSATEDMASDTGPTDTAVTSTARGRLMLRPSLTTTAVTSTAELPDPPASGRDQPRLVTGLSAESGFG